MKIKETIKLYVKYASVCTQSVMQYKLSFLLMIIGRFIMAFSELIAIQFLFSGFSQIKDYTYGDVLLCFSIIQMSFTFAELFGNGFKAFSGTVKKGEFDRMMLRPCSLLLQVMGTRFEIGRTGPLLTALITLALGIRHSQITWSILTVWTLAAMIIGGTFLFIGLFMLGASFCFFSIEDTSLINVLTYGAKTHGKYPIDIYGKGILRFCTYVIPYTLIQYYPLQFLLGKTRSWYLAFCPLGMIVFLLVCYFIWQFGVKHYQSCGS
ncbi:MAG: ABC-2 family transporter protein [Lachnospiraceae bacterium]|nr:ABC-2 family transporter protein [Lachnospiraceae bacterium]MDE7238286.1 ABC-2 family transporter protein [Lachnospiraceae bacterium]